MVMIDSSLSASDSLGIFWLWLRWRSEKRLLWLMAVLTLCITTHYSRGIVDYDSRLFTVSTKDARKFRTGAALHNNGSKALLTQCSDHDCSSRRKLLVETVNQHTLLFGNNHLLLLCRTWNNLCPRNRF